MEPSVLMRLKRVAGKQTTTLTHYGRKTGEPHEVRCAAYPSNCCTKTPLRDGRGLWHSANNR
jgi:hypothetical protein